MDIKDMTLSEIYVETCKLVRQISILAKAQARDGKLEQRLSALRGEHDRRTCLPMLA